MYKYLLLLLTALTITGTAMAQDSMSTVSGKTITLQEAIKVALDNNYQVKKAKNNLELADMNHKSAMANFFPSLNGRLSGNETSGQQFNQATVSFTNQISNSMSGGLSANLTVFDGMRNIYHLRQSDQGQLSQKEQLRQQRQDIIFNTASNYLQILLDQQLLGIDQENLKSSQSQLDQVKAEVQVGSRPVADQYNQEATVAQNQLSVIQQRNKLDIDKLALVRQLQIDPLKNYTFVKPELDTTAIQEGVPDLSTLINTALNNRSDIQSQKYAINAAYYNMKMAEGQRYPTLSLNAGVNTYFNDKYPDPTNPGHIMPFDRQFFRKNVNKQIGFSISVPLFNNLNTSYNVQSAKVNYQNMKLDMQNMRLNVIQEVRQAYNDYKNYAEQLKSTRVAVVSAQKAYETQKERYQVGAGTLVELTQANAQYVQAQSNRQQALYRFIFQEQLINYYMGQINANMQIKALNFNN